MSPWWEYLYGEGVSIMTHLFGIFSQPDAVINSENCFVNDVILQRSILDSAFTEDRSTLLIYYKEIDQGI